MISSTDAVTVLTMMPVRGEALERFFPVLRADLAAGRAAVGNIAFDAYLPEGSAGCIHVFERWRDRDAIDRHRASPHRAALDARLGTDLSGAPEPWWLKPVRGVPEPLAGGYEGGAASRNLVIRLEVQPEHRAEFIDRMAEAIVTSRADTGSLVYDLYEIEGQPEAFVLYERWKGVEHHLMHLSRSHMAGAFPMLEKVLAKPIDGASRKMLRDISLHP